jgi:hypothetical protein
VGSKFRKIRGISFLAEELQASQEGLCCMGLVGWLVGLVGSFGGLIGLVVFLIWLVDWLVV